VIGFFFQIIVLKYIFSFENLGKLFILIS